MLAFLRKLFATRICSLCNGIGSHLIPAGKPGVTEKIICCLCSGKGRL